MGLHQRLFNRNILMALFIFSVGIISNCAYFFSEAKTLQDYANFVLFFTASVACANILNFIIFNMQQIFGCVQILVQFTIVFRTQLFRIKPYLSRIQSFDRKNHANSAYCFNQYLVPNDYDPNTDCELWRLLF